MLRGGDLVIFKYILTEPYNEVINLMLANYSNGQRVHAAED